METSPPSVSVDDSHPLVRRGMAAGLDGAGIRVAGESSRWRPCPRGTELDVLVFEAQYGGLERAVAFRQRFGRRLGRALPSTDGSVHDALLKMNYRNRPHAVAEATRQGII